MTNNYQTTYSENKKNQLLYNSRILLAAAILLLLSSFVTRAQINVPGTSTRWIDSGVNVENGTQIQISATGTVNVGTRGTFGPEGTTGFSGDQNLSFPTDNRYLYGLVIRLTSSRTNPDDEIRQDYAYATNRTICFSSAGHLWLRVNDNTPADNSGAFLTTISRGTCGTTETSVRTTRIHVSNDNNANVSGADVYINGERQGITNNEGILSLPTLNNGDRIIARKLIMENQTGRAGHQTGSTRGWNFRVYLTTMSVNDDGTLSPFTINNPSGMQELRLKNTNTLIGIHLVASVEWDASPEELQNIRNEISIGSQRLYNASDGQIFFEQIEISDMSNQWSDADINIFANWSLRANVNYIGGMFGDCVFCGHAYMNMQRNSWSYVYTHEFAHYGLEVSDEYADNDGNTFCTRNLGSTSTPFGWNDPNRGPKASCLMWNTAPKFCSNLPENRHARGTRQGDTDCWTHIVSRFQDNNSPRRWTMQSPNTRGTTPGMLPPIPVSDWQTRFNTNNLTRPQLCAPQLFLVTDADDRPLRDIDVFNRTGYGATILEGKSRFDDPDTPMVDETGQIVVIGLHVGDEVQVSGGSFRVSGCDLIGTNQTLRPSENFIASLQPVSFINVESDLFPLIDQQQVKNVIRVTPNAFRLAASLEPAVETDGARVIVKTDTSLNIEPEVEMIVNGEVKTRYIKMKYEAAANVYSGTVSQLPSGSKGLLQIAATDKSGRRVTQWANFALASSTPQKETDIFSANGQLSFSIPEGGFNANTRLSVSTSDALPPSITDDLVLPSGIFKISASNSNKLNRPGVLRFHLPDQPLVKNPNGYDGTIAYDPQSFEIRWFNEKTNEWENLGGTLLPEVATITVQTDKLGSFALVARPLKTNQAKNNPNRQSQTSDKFTVTGAEIKADEAFVSGKCPVTVKFTGNITTNGAGTIQYAFTRQDGATGPIQTMTFSRAGTQTVTTTWTLGGKGLESYKGWMGIKILTPNQFETDSETGKFTMKCEL